MSQPSTTHKDWLAHYADKLARDLAAIKRVDCKKAELDIQARTLDLKLAKKYRAEIAARCGRDSKRSG